MQGEGIYLDALEAERAGFTSQHALALHHTNQRLAVVSIYNALGGGCEICAQADYDCAGADGTPNSRFAKPITYRP